MRRTLLTSLVTAAAVLLALLVPTATAAASPAFCGQVWGSQGRSDVARSEGIDETAQITGVRAGRHACFDRLVLDVDEPLTAWSVRYVHVIRTDGHDGPDSGTVVPVRGGARLEVTAHALGPAQDPAFTPGRRSVDVAGYRTLRDVVQAGSTEAVTTLGLGVRARLPFRVFVLPGPGDGSRLVVDVGHRWCARGHTRC